MSVKVTVAAETATSTGPATTVPFSSTNEILVMSWVLAVAPVPAHELNLNTILATETGSPLAYCKASKRLIRNIDSNVLSSD